MRTFKEFEEYLQEKALESGDASGIIRRSKAISSKGTNSQDLLSPAAISDRERRLAASQRAVQNTPSQPVVQKPPKPKPTFKVGDKQMSKAEIHKEYDRLRKDPAAAKKFGNAAFKATNPGL